MINVHCVSLLGFVCINYPELMLEKGAKELYLSWLAKETPLKLKLQVIGQMYSSCTHREYCSSLCTVFYSALYMYMYTHSIV